MLWGQQVLALAGRPDFTLEVAGRSRLKRLGVEETEESRRLKTPSLLDRSWHVVTRSKPIQKYFESGFPHGADQLIDRSIGLDAVATSADIV